MKRCPFCETENDDDAFYCQECDNPISDIHANATSGESGQSSMSLADDDTPQLSPLQAKSKSGSVKDKAGKIPDQSCHI